LHDGLQRIVELDLHGSDQVLTELYLHGTEPNEIVATDVFHSGAYETVWGYTDLLGSLTSVASQASGDWKVVHNITREYGSDRQPLGDTTEAVLTSTTIWAGHHLDDDTGLLEAKARWYDPSSGRFISQDPIGFAAGDANLYRYVGNGPTNATDPSGLKDPSVTTQTFGPHDNNRVIHAPGPGQWMTGISRITSDCISGRDTYSCLSLPVDDIASQWLTDARTTQAAADLMYQDMRTIINSFSGVAVKQSALAARPGIRQVRWADRPGFSPFIEDTTHNGTPYKVIWSYSSRKGRIGEIEAVQWGVVPGNLSDEDAAQFYIDDFEQRMSAAKVQTAVDVSLIAGGQFLATFRALRLASVSRTASLEASLAARTMTRNEWAAYSRLQRIGQQGVAAKAEQVLSNYISRIPVAERGNIATTVAAYNRNNGLIAIGTNGDIPSRIALPLARAAEGVGGVGHSFSVVQQNGRIYRLTVGRCAEFHAGNRLLLRTPGSTLSDIGFTKAIRPRTGEVISPCLNCEQMYWLPYLIGH
ncbi:RHS repeat-associated core domain-containing protein, partial [Stieleria sp. TO1_6]|uniref:RHS repeat-associated core domain-containing protein n=1 Tax=Stieleria tagensis TaxID=2956795 RepID=UPI00209B2746